MRTNLSQRLVSWLSPAMAALLAILPIAGTTALRNLLFAIAVVLTSIIYARKYADRSLSLTHAPLWLAYIILAGINLFWAVDLKYSALEIYQELVLGSLFFWLGINAFWLDKNSRFAAPALLGANIILCTYSIICLIFRFTTKDGLIGTVNTGVGNFSTYIVTVFPVLVWIGFERLKETKKRYFLFYTLFIFIINFFALYATQNRQGLIALTIEVVLASILLAIHYKRFYLLLVAALVAVIAALAFQDHAIKRAQPVEIGKALTADGRMGRWTFALEQSLQTPLIGAGLGRDTFKHRYPEHPMTEGFFVHAHNTLINRLVQLGWPGVILFLTLFFAPVWTLFSRRHASEPSYCIALTGLCLSLGVLSKNMTDDFFVRELAYFYWALLGGLIAWQGRAIEESTGNSIQRGL